MDCKESLYWAQQQEKGKGYCTVEVAVLGAGQQDRI